MRRIAIIAAGFLALCALAANSAVGQSEDDGTYIVRAYFDNAGFLVNDLDVRIAGARVGGVEDVDVARDGEIATADGEEAPGKAVAVLRIEDPGFQDFRTDASCLIRPQSLLGEKFVECDPTQPRAPGSELPPPLEQIADGEIGEGEYFLPLENNGKQVDLDLLNNVTREPEADRLRLILNDLGAGLAARGEDLAEVIRRANPALQETDKVLAILAEQNRGLAQLAADSDQILAPLARERESLSGFIRNASIAGAAAAERRDDIALGFERFPPALDELEKTMVELRRFAVTAEPVATNLSAAAPGLTGATEALGPFSRAGTPALLSLGDATEAAGPDLAASNPVINQLRVLGETTIGPARDLQGLLRTFRKTNGIEYLTRLVLNFSNVLNGFDDYGHYLRTELQITNCINYVTVVKTGCEADWFETVPTTSAAGAYTGPTGPVDMEERAREAAEQLEASGTGGDAVDLAPSIGAVGGTEGDVIEPSDAAAAAEASTQGTRDLLEFLTGDGR